MYPIFAFLTLVTPGLYDILANFQSLKTTLLRLLCESSKQAVLRDFPNFPTFYMGSALPLGLALFIYIKVLFYEIVQHPPNFDYSAGQKKRYKYCFMKQKFQIQMIIPILHGVLEIFHCIITSNPHLKES